MPLENPGERRAANTMPKILEGSLDPRVAPRGMLFRHPDDHGLNLGEDTVTARALARLRPPRTMSCRCHRKIVSGVTMVEIGRKTCRPSR